jgi:hypothetical protein
MIEERYITFHLQTYFVSDRYFNCIGNSFSLKMQIEKVTISKFQICRKTVTIGKFQICRKAVTIWKFRICRKKLVSYKFNQKLFIAKFINNCLRRKPCKKIFSWRQMVPLFGMSPFCSNKCMYVDFCSNKIM